MEVYLLKVHFKKALSKEELEKCLKKTGFKIVKSNDISTAYELDTSKGITEIQFYEKEGFIPSFYIRFSVINPCSVINQTFGVLNKLKRWYNIKIEDWEIDEIIQSPQKHLSKIKEKMIEKRKELLSNKHITSKPIRGGSVTLKYIQDLKKNKQNKSK